jgi:hypothetical protein
MCPGRPDCQSRVKLRNNLGPDCEVASVSAAIVIENTVPGTVIIELATVARRERAPSAPPDQSHPADVGSDCPIGPASIATVQNDRPIATNAMSEGTNQEFERKLSHKWSTRDRMHASLLTACPERHLTRLLQLD